MGLGRGRESLSWACCWTIIMVVAVSDQISVDAGDEYGPNDA